MDNSFATKRWVEPDEWARVIRDLGISCIEASADTEIDPFLCGSEYLDEWLEQVREASREWGVSVVNFYTGYTTYRTLGLAHPDPRIRTRVVDDWLKVMARVRASVRGSGSTSTPFPRGYSKIRPRSLGPQMLCTAPLQRLRALQANWGQSR